MRTLPGPLMVALLLLMTAAPGLAGSTKPWKTESHPSAAADEIPSYCKSLAALIQKRLAELRAIRVAVDKHKTEASSSVLEFTERLMGNDYQTDWERQQLATLAKGKAEAIELNERYKDQKCGSIDIEQEIARAPGKEAYKPLKSHEPKFKIR